MHSVFSGVNLELFKGDRLGVVGSNGSGKSTLLRLMAKIHAPTSGHVAWAPEITVSLLALGLGFKPELSGRDNAMLAAMLLGFSRTVAKSNLKNIEEFCELGKFFDEPVKIYSSGMRARLGFATALLSDATVLLIDEVLGVGDHHFREKAASALRDQFDSRTVVLVSHSNPQIESLCNRAVWLGKNGIEADGPVPEVLFAYSKGSAPEPPVITEHQL